MKVIFSIIFMCLVGACTKASPTEVEVRNEHSSTIYTLNIDGCKVVWDLYSPGNNRQGYIVDRSLCELPIEKQHPYIRQVAVRVMKDTGGTWDIDQIILGRLADHAGLSFRLAAAASMSPLWDSKRGKPIEGDLNTTVLKIANDGNVFQAYQEAMDGLEINVQPSTAEKVLVQSAEKLPYFNKLKKLGVKGNQKLPYDFLAELERK